MVGIAFPVLQVAKEFGNVKCSTGHHGGLSCVTLKPELKVTSWRNVMRLASPPLFSSRMYFAIGSSSDSSPFTAASESNVTSKILLTEARLNTESESTGRLLAPSA